MKIAVLLATTAFASVGLAQLASAQCLPAAPANGGTVTCAANDPDGFTTSAANVTVNILEGVTVSANDALRLNGAANIVTNAGNLDGQDEGIDIRGAGTQVSNATTGSIKGADRGIDADGNAGLTVTNSGEIVGVGSDAIRAGANATITNLVGASIMGMDEGIQVTRGLNLTNNGSLDAADEGIEATDDAIIVNTGTITAVDDAIQTDDRTSITNSNLIESSENDAIDIDTGSVVNTGTIRTTEGGEDGIDFDPEADLSIISTVDNGTDALIEGLIGINVDADNNARQAIVNRGTIIGRSGLAIFLEEGDDSLTLFGTGIVDGLTDLGAGEDALNLSGNQAALVGGGSLFDGGLGLDIVRFDVPFEALLQRFLGRSNAFSLTFRNDDATVSRVAVRGFETFEFSDRTVGVSELPAPVPLPAPILLLAGGLGLLGLARRMARG